MNKKVLVVGAGLMAHEYLNVLKDIGAVVKVIGRGAENIAKLKSEFPNFECAEGGVALLSRDEVDGYDFAINTVNIEYLEDTTSMLVDLGIKNVLVEKPGGLDIAKMKKLHDLSLANKSNILIAHNRRFFQSVKRLILEAELDGGITSALFDFTEWTHTFGRDSHSESVLNKWIISNSSHVIDTVFFLIGDPVELNSQTAGKNVIDWHRSGSVFTGSGKSSSSIPFSYHANWVSAGRWSIEVCTNKRRFFLVPMEQLKQQKLGEIKIEDIDIDNEVDTRYKPGLFQQTVDFLCGEHRNFINLEGQIERHAVYSEIGAY